VAFLLGALLGGAIGFTAGFLVLSRRGAAIARTPAAALGVGTLALVVAVVALARSSPGTRTEVRTIAAPPPSTATTSASTTTTTTAPRDAMVVVPSVQGLQRDAATAELQAVGLKVSLESISLANVPSGHVISQTPLPDSTVPVGTTVQLVVSAAA
jgi:PASTA domain-containing protein